MIEWSANERKIAKNIRVDACILFSFFNRDSVRRKIIEELSNSGCKLISPEFAFVELISDKLKIMKYGKIDNLSFVFLLSLLERKIELFSKKVYAGFLAEANKISPHRGQTKDDPYFALALVFNSPIWSDESGFKQQSRVKVLSTKELLDLLK
ncbi:MAG: hypothetical protein J7J51_04705 [Candidatus Omnitrophica bacterium]|nr:hypothetical protein [Candidatus Omnitrophota bacterium]